MARNLLGGFMCESQICINSQTSPNMINELKKTHTDKIEIDILKAPCIFTLITLYYISYTHLNVRPGFSYHPMLINNVYCTLKSQCKDAIHFRIVAIRLSGQ